MQVLATSMHSTRSSSDYTMAALWAESKLDIIGVGEPIEPGSTNGRFDDNYSWQLDIQLVDPQSVEPPPQQYAMSVGSGMQQNPGMQQRMTTSAGNSGALQVSPFDLYELDLTVSWGGRFGSNQHSARFTTLRTMNPDPSTQQGSTPQSGASGQAGAIKR
jgi:general secretion pathway protein I